MSSTLIICLTVVLVFLIHAALTVWGAKHDAERAEQQQKEARDFGAEVSALTLRLNDALEALEQREADASNEKGYLCGRVEVASDNTSKAVLALSERVSIMEAAMKNAILQMVQVTGFTEERHKQFLAASVRGNGKRPA